MSLFAELKRRNVFRVGIAYVVAAWLLLQLTEVLTGLLDVSTDVGKIVIIFLIIGFPVALIFAWAFELTPEGIKREKEVDRSQSIAAQTGRKLDRVIIGILAVVIALLVLERFAVQESDAPGSAGSGADTAVNQPATGSETPASIAVLPFVNMSSDPEQEFFSDGISEEILNVLARIPELRVAARTSSFQFKGQNLDIADIARQLRVSHVLEGSVRKAGDRLRITAQLIEAESGFHLWSETFDRQLEDVFAIQDEISGAIAGALRSQLAPAAVEEATPVAMSAYELYLKGRSLVATRGEDHLFESYELLERAIEIAPDYAPAMATLSRAYAVLPWFSNRIPAGEVRERARRWALRALALDPHNDEAMAALSIVLRESDLDNDGALELLERALAVNPGSVAAHNFLGDLYTRSADLDRALVHESRAAELDPLGHVQLTDLATVHMLRGDLAKVLELSDQALELSPGFPNAVQLRLYVYHNLGDLEGLRRTVRLAEETLGDADLGARLIAPMILNLAENDQAAANARMQKVLTALEQGLVSYSEAAFGAVIVGDHDLAGRLLREAVAAREGLWTFPLHVRLPEQAPDSEDWQAFWALPGPSRLADIRRANGFDPNPPEFGQGRL